MIGLIKLLILRHTNKNTIMEQNKNANAILFHIEHSKPIEISEFITSLNAIGNLFSSFAKKNGDCKESAKSKLYVEKIEDGCIDIILCEVVAAGMLPFMENMNVILEFSSYVKNVIDYLTKGEGTKPELDFNECKGFKELMTVTAGDNNGSTEIGAINKTDKGNVYNNCTFNFQESNSAQNQLEKRIESIKSVQPITDVYARQLMTIYQMRSDMGTDKGNKAVIDSISQNKLSVVFETDELKEKILHSDSNPTKKGFLVDVVLLTAQDKIVAYKVTALHDIIDLE